MTDKLLEVSMFQGPPQVRVRVTMEGIQVEPHGPGE